MSLSVEDRDHLLALLDAVWDQRASTEQMADIERIVLRSPEATVLYLKYLELHGTLLWDGGCSLGSDDSHVAAESDLRPSDSEADGFSPPRRAAAEAPRRSKVGRWPVPAALALMALCIGILVGRGWQPAAQPQLADAQAGKVDEVSSSSQSPSPVTTPTDSIARGGSSTNPRQPVVLAPTITEAERTDLAALPPAAQEAVSVQSTSASVPERKPLIEIPDLDPAALAALDDVERVSVRVDAMLKANWLRAELKPAARSDDAEWFRRTSLDIIGRIPTPDELTAFLADERPGKQRRAVDALLEDSGYIRNYSTIWANLLVGRSPRPGVDREALKKFLRLNFAENRPWTQTVAALLSAEGRADENGAANFLVAHLNNQAVPATAITSRLFLGFDLHCNQCHNHPFNNSTQTAFWELNSLFQQTAVVTRRIRDEKTGRMGPPIAALTTQVEGGPIYYETTNGLMKVAFPRFNGQEVDPGPMTNRRQELARLLVTEDQPQIAAALVNRYWAHFMGAGFTHPVEDMGQHNPPSHPEILNLLRDEFIKSGYDVKQLIRWICASDLYQRSSRPVPNQTPDDPTAGDVPQFTRIYPRLMTAEQLYDSVVTATQAHQSGALDWSVAESQRQAWLDEFVVSLQNDENAEQETLSGTYSQALTLMNGGLMQHALDLSPGTFLGELVRSKATETEKIRRICLTALSRQPTARELPAMQRMVREAAAAPTTRSKFPKGSVGYQDLLWALLNSNEFSVIH